MDKGTVIDAFGVDKGVSPGWISAGDGLLFMDRNQDGGDGRGFDGIGTKLSNGRLAGNGYLALAEPDSNGGGVMDLAYASLAELMMRVDRDPEVDSDGVGRAPDLYSLTSLGITQADLHPQKSALEDKENWADSSLTVPVALPNVRHDFVPRLTEVVSLDGLDLRAMPVAASDSAVDAMDLRTHMSSLVDALAAFGRAGDSAVAIGDSPQTFEGSAKTVSPALSGGMVSILDALKQFDVNGRELHGYKVSSEISNSLDMKPLKPDVAILANGK